MQRNWVKGEIKEVEVERKEKEVEVEVEIETTKNSVWNTRPFVETIKQIRNALNLYLGKKTSQYSEKAAMYLHNNIRLNRLETVVGGFTEKDKPLSLWHLLEDHSLIASDNIDELITRLRFVITPMSGMRPAFSPELKTLVLDALLKMNNLRDDVKKAEIKLEQALGGSDTESDDEESFSAVIEVLTRKTIKKEEIKFYARHFSMFPESPTLQRLKPHAFEAVLSIEEKTTSKITMKPMM